MSYFNIGYTNNQKYSYLFGNYSLFNSKPQNSYMNNLFNIDFAEYHSIKSGTYSKVLKSYYDKFGTDGIKEQFNSTNKESTVSKTILKDNAKDLYSKLTNVVSKGEESIFNKVKNNVTNEYDYDKDLIYSSISNVANSYNTLIKSAANVSDTTPLRQTVNLINTVSANSGLLSKIGVSINTDNTLSIDEAVFKKADMSTIQSLFSGIGSLGYKMQLSANNIHLSTNNLLGNTSYYTSDGRFSNYNSGNLINALK